jgi:PBP1b-binding outer membrane lipoprotein LpoB
MRTKHIAAAFLLLTLAGCSSSSSPAPSAQGATTPVPASTTLEPQPTSTPTTADPGQVFADWMATRGFDQGAPAYTVDALGEAVCGNLQTESMAAEITYEESVDKSPETGMTTDKDILAMIGESVVTYCPQYTKDLPAN